MKPVIVLPMNDPLGIFFPHLKAITPVLKTVFAQAYISVPHPTRKLQPAYIAWLQTDDFYQALYHEEEMSIGDDFAALYRFAASACRPNQILHLCFIDRVAFALQTEFRADFMADVQAITPDQVPLIFHRSPDAWQTHPSNYVKLEQIVTSVGEYLFDKTLDFAWCHLVVQANQLQRILPFIKRRDISMEAEIILQLRDNINTKEVDWLAWEDPFIYGQQAVQLKSQREQSHLETRKRLGYIIPMLQLLEATIEFPEF